MFQVDTVPIREVLYPAISIDIGEAVYPFGYLKKMLNQLKLTNSTKEKLRPILTYGK